jgi:magnesium transporter
MPPNLKNVPGVPELPPGVGSHRLLFFGEMHKRPVCKGSIKERLGKLTDLVFALKEPYPECAGLYLEHGWGKPTEFIPWPRVLRIEEDAIFVQPPEGESYPPFVDQPGWILLGDHLLGRTILDMDGRRTEVVNDIQLMLTQKHLLLVQVDTSFNGFLRRWRLGGKRWSTSDLIAWKYVQPLSVEDAARTDAVSLSVTRRQLKELPPEDLADALEELHGEEQQALFSALDSETAAETLLEAEPRAQRQLIANLRRERAGQILGEMSVHQMANLLAILPHDDSTELLELLPPDAARRVQAILSEQEVKARSLMDADYLTFPKETQVGDALARIRGSGLEPEHVSYVYVLGEDGKTAIGVVDLRELVLAPDAQPLGEMMSYPVVAAEEDDTREDIAQIFTKYHYRMLPVVDAEDRLLGVVRFNDIMKGQT